MYRIIKYAIRKWIEKNVEEGQAFQKNYKVMFKKKSLKSLLQNKDKYDQTVKWNQAYFRLVFSFI